MKTLRPKGGKVLNGFSVFMWQNSFYTCATERISFQKFKNAQSQDFLSQEDNEKVRKFHKSGLGANIRVYMLGPGLRSGDPVQTPRKKDTRRLWRPTVCHASRNLRCALSIRKSRWARSMGCGTACSNKAPIRIKKKQNTHQRGYLPRECSVIWHARTPRMHAVR